MSMLYLLANFTLALSMKPGMIMQTQIQMHHPETFIGWNAKERCEEARHERLKQMGRSKHGTQEIVGMCMGS